MNWDAIVGTSMFVVGLIVAVVLIWRDLRGRRRDGSRL